MERGKRYAPRHLKTDGGRKTMPARPGKRNASGAAPETRGNARAGGRGAALEGARSRLLFEESLLPMVERMHHITQHGLRAGVIWLLLLPVLLAVIRRLTDSSKVAFLIIWIIGMFIISAALIFVAYADHQLKRFLGEVKQYVPQTDAELDALLPELGSLSEAPELLRAAIERRRERQESGGREAYDA